MNHIPPLDVSRLAERYAHSMPSSIREHRRQRLHVLLQEVGGQAALAELIKRERNQVWQWTLPEDDARGRGIGPKMARMLERCTGKPEGWLDRQESLPSDHPLSQEMRPAADTLRAAVEITDRVLSNARVAVTAQARSDITMAVYDLIREGHGIAGAERTVAQMLRAVGGITTTTD